MSTNSTYDPATDTERVSSTWLRQLRTEYLQFADETTRLRNWLTFIMHDAATSPDGERVHTLTKRALDGEDAP